jgi:EmrB/QacA subfamily drug resistance transporter
MQEPTTQSSGRGKVLIGLMLSMGLAAMDTTIVATAIPAIVRDLGDFTLFAWVFSIYTLIQAVTIPIFSKLTDLYGRKPILIAGIIIFVGGSALSGLSWSMLALIFFRALQGVGAGIVQPVISTVAGDLYNVEERGRVQGWLSSVWGIAAVIGPAIGGLLTQYTSWRWIFYINIPIGALALLMIGLYLRENVTRKHHDIDYLGAAFLAVGIGLLIFALLSGGVRWAWLSLTSITIFAIALIALVAFVWQERRAAEPIMPLWIFEQRILVGSNLATVALGLLTIGLSSFLPTYAQGVLGASTLVAGFVIAVMSISWPLASAFSSKVYMRVGFRNAALIGAVICLIASLIFSALPEATTVLLAALGSFVMGLGLGLLSTPLLVGLQSVVGWNYRGVVTGSNMFARQFGQTIGAAIFGSIINASLAGWLMRAPRNLASQLPQSVDAVSQSISSSQASHLAPAAAAYLREGLYQASHLVFVGLVIIAVLGVLATLLTPSRFKNLDLDITNSTNVEHAKPSSASVEAPSYQEG